MVGNRCLWPGSETEEEDPVGCPCTWGQEGQEQWPESPRLHGQFSSCPAPPWCVPAMHQVKKKKNLFFFTGPKSANSSNLARNATRTQINVTKIHTVFIAFLPWTQKQHCERSVKSPCLCVKIQIVSVPQITGWNPDMGIQVVFRIFWKIIVHL